VTLILVDSVRTDVCRCNLCWKDETTLIIGWAKSVKVFMQFDFFIVSVCSLNTYVEENDDYRFLEQKLM